MDGWALGTPDEIGRREARGWAEREVAAILWEGGGERLRISV